MRALTFAALCSLLAAALFADTSHAQVAPPRAPASSPVHVDPLALAFATGPGGVHPVARQEWVGALVERSPAATLEQLEAIRGVRLRRVDGRPITWRRWVSLDVSESGARRLAASGLIASLRLSPASRPPLDASNLRMGLDAGRGAGGRSDLYSGEGVLISDADSHVDIFHPDFFYADAGWYDWIDRNDNGSFDPGTDAVDLNANGRAEPGEMGLALRGSPLDISRGEEAADVRGVRFDPRVDWVFADSDEDGARGFGAAMGFSDDDPAFGEPLFVPDDVDGNGRLDRDERLVRLGTSKFQRILVDVDFGSTTHQHEYVRGVDLSASPSDVTGGVYGYADTLHGSGVLGIAAGGVLLPSRRWVGIAPMAELSNSFAIGGGDAQRLVWSYALEPDVMLHEYVLWTRIPLDGSDVYSVLIDESAAAGVANICPGGNIGGADKHAQLSLAAGQTATLRYTFPEGIQQVEVSMSARGDGALSMEVEDPMGERYSTAQPFFELAGGGQLYTQQSLSERGTQIDEALFVSPGRTSGAWTVHVTATGGALEVHGMLSDEAGFSRSTAWESATPASTIAAPATADRCLAIGSIAAHLASENTAYQNGGFEQAFEVREYSARGPRIDGDLRPHVLAPDNPWAPLGTGDVYPSIAPGFLDAPHGAYAVFGGTSGAGPHVAGLAALLVESGLSGEAVLERIRDTAVGSEFAGAVPNSDYGYGHVRADLALGGFAEGEAPRVTLRAEPAFPMPGQTVRLVVDASDADGDALEVRWDDDYDGVFDGEYGDRFERDETWSALGEHRFKVRVRDDTGLIAEAAVRVLVTDMPPPVDAGPQPVSDAGAPTDGSVVTPPESDGCGCRTVGAPSGSPGLLIALVLGLLSRSRRRKRGA